MQEPSLASANGVLPRVANAALFQIGWFGCVLGGDVVALPLTLTLLWVHCAWISGTIRECGFILLVGCLGWVVDSLVTAAGLLHFSEPGLGLIPAWLVCLWILFATTLRHSLQWLCGRIKYAAIAGAISGPLSYIAGVGLAPGAALGAEPLLSIAVLCLVWAVLFPTLLVLARRW